jgi:hypothetical protein
MPRVFGVVLVSLAVEYSGSAENAFDLVDFDDKFDLFPESFLHDFPSLPLTVCFL